MTSTRTRRLLAVLAILVGVVLGNFVFSFRLLWQNYSAVLTAMQTATYVWGAGHLRVRVEERKAEGQPGKELGTVEVWSRRDGYQAKVQYEDVALQFAEGPLCRVWLTKTGASFVGKGKRFELCRRWFRRTARKLPKLRWQQVALTAVVLHPVTTGVVRIDGTPCYSIRFRLGSAAVDREGLLRRLVVRVPGEKSTFVVEVARDRQAAPSPPPQARSVTVPAVELDRSLAAALDIVSLQSQPVRREPDGRRTEGAGWLVCKDGHRVLHLEGDPYQLGYQHGRLLAAGVRRLCNRIVYGVGLYYSLDKGTWFPAEAKRLVARQRRFIDPGYLAEMRGLADGAGVPLAEVEAANIFPEFFHCSGAALFGRATKNGELIHARVLDYMTEVGLQDEAVVMAVKPAGRNAFVNVGYAGFIGSVTGMNEKKIAIGEMGGRGEGLWDGTPMSFLVRGALEHCDSLEAALAYMRRHHRTCEYFYVISDGNRRTAAGVAATPEGFQVIRPGQAVPQLPEAVPDAVVLSAGDRYKELVKRIREHYGTIDVAELLEIIKRPVAMKSNLHNAVFAPEHLRLWVNNASRSGPACNEPAVKHEWSELFPAAAGTGKSRAPKKR